MDSVLQKLYRACDELNSAVEEFFSIKEGLDSRYDDNDHLLFAEKSLDDASCALSDAVDALSEFSDEQEYDED